MLPTETAKEELKVFTESYTNELLRTAKRNKLLYKMDQFPFKKKFPKGGTELFIDKRFSLNPIKSDLENSIALYEQLKEMNETQASDPRLWVYLSHVRFWSYMRGRWPIEKPIKQGKAPEKRIAWRYFLPYINLRFLVRNGISRLWWYAHLTYNESNPEDPYDLTRVLLKNSDFAQNILERSFGSNKTVRFAILKYFKNHPEKSKSKEVYRDIFKKINLAAGVRNLPYLNELEIISLIERISE